jgi:hypothetical protein
MGHDRHDIFGYIGPGIAVDVPYDMGIIEDLLLLRQLKRTSIGQIGEVDPQVKGVAGRRLCSTGRQESDGRNDSRDPKGHMKWH